MRIKIVCTICGSDDVRRDAWAEWDLEKQDWILGTVFDAGHCEKCEENSTLGEVEILDNHADLNLEAPKST